jgi:hypothetical protein
LDGAGNSAAEEIGVHRLGGVKSPDARPDLRLGRAGGAGQEIAFKRKQVHGPARFGFSIHTFYCAGENPRMAAEKRFLASGFEN